MKQLQATIHPAPGNLPGTGSQPGLQATNETAAGRLERHEEKPSPAAEKINRRLIVGMLVFEGFQLLDTFGPLEMLGSLVDEVTILLIGENMGPVVSTCGPTVVTDHSFANTPPLDIFMIPGGIGTRREVNSQPFIEELTALAERTPLVATICTGAALLARTGLLDGFKATTNKRSYQWATSQGEKVHWVSQARWVEDGKYFTSSGVSAGIDMTLAIIDKLFGRETAIRIANGAEYEWQTNPDYDPFAKLNGLVE